MEDEQCFLNQNNLPTTYRNIVYYGRKTMHFKLKHFVNYLPQHTLYLVMEENQCMMNWNILLTTYRNIVMKENQCMLNWNILLTGSSHETAAVLLPGFAIKW